MDPILHEENQVNKGIKMVDLIFVYYDMYRGYLHAGHCHIR